MSSNSFVSLKCIYCGKLTDSRCIQVCLPCMNERYAKDKRTLKSILLTEMGDRETLKWLVYKMVDTFTSEQVREYIEELREE